MREYGLDKLLKAVSAEFRYDETPPSDLIATLYYLIYTLPVNNVERDAQILLDYYLTDCNFEELGRKYAMSSEKIEQTIKHCIKLLNQRDRQMLLYRGLDTKIKERVDKAYSKGYRNGVEYMLNKDYIPSDIYKSERIKLLSTIELGELNVSARLFNCLMRGGYKTVGDIVSAGGSKVMQCKNLGKACYDELVAALVKYGEKPEDWAL